MNGIQTNARETCMMCDAPLSGRKDKRFCDDVCRVRHHRTGVQRVLHDVDRVLHRNRSLLRRIRADASWCLEDPAGCFMWLRRAGYDFNFHTHVAGLHDGRLAVMCYEEGFVVEENGVQVLDRPMIQQPWMEQSVAEPAAVWCDLKRLLKGSASRR